MFSPGIWWIGSRMYRSGSDVQILQMYSQGVVSCDRFTHGYVHFPALWMVPEFDGVLPRGTPVAQVIPVPRAGPALAIQAMSDSDMAKSREVQEALQAGPGVYRKTYCA